jgi:hypothetical protein
MLEAAIALSLASDPEEEVRASPSYTEQRDLLRGMGFIDDVANQVALEGTGGDVHRVLEMLLG